ncbi:MAG: hypothetical protein U5J97_09300 [Trueperaceae bacterium]|nr:hypothetical protein [Trueperaceae bacterium]
MTDFVRFLAAWSLLHESADEGWKAAVQRGEGLEPGRPGQGPDAFVDGLAALVNDEKERLKRELSTDDANEAAREPIRSSADLADKLDAVAFELAELRGRLESLQASVDALAARRDD